MLMYVCINMGTLEHESCMHVNNYFNYFSRKLEKYSGGCDKRQNARFLRPKINSKGPVKRFFAFFVLSDTFVPVFRFPP